MGRDYQLARAEGLTDADLVAMLEDSGLRSRSWTRRGPGSRGPPSPHPAGSRPEDLFCFAEEDLFAIADAVGARSVNAVDVFGGSWTLECHRGVRGLCRRAAEHGLLVQLEFLPWSKIPDLASAWEIVRDAGPARTAASRSTRGTTSAPCPDAALLKTIPGQAIVGVQLSDGPARAETDLVDATLHERLLPGDGEMDLASLLAGLRSAGSEAPFGVEVFSDALHELSGVEAATRAVDAAARARSD